MSERRAAAAMGALFLVATASYVAGSQLLERGRLVGGALFVLVDALAVVGIAVLAFPILRRSSDAIALSYLALRILEAALLLVGALGALSGIERSNYWAYQLAMAVLGPGGLMFSYVLYRARLVPRPIAILGIVGYPSLAMGAALDMLGRVDTLHGGGMIFLAPGGLFELILPIWLIARGLRSDA